MKKNILIVGGTSGLGKYITDHFVKKKYKVFIIGRKVSKDLLNKIIFYKVDIFNNIKFSEILNNLKTKEFQIIIHNIGGSLGIKNINSSVKDYYKLWFYNLGNSIQINNLFLNKMKKRKWGRILHVSSATSYNITGGGPYSSAKSALNSYVKCVANEYGKHNVIISSICPGPINLQNRFLAKQQKKKTKFWNKFALNHLPMKRLANPGEIIPIIDLLVSEEASYCSGAVWSIDGLQK